MLPVETAMVNLASGARSGHAGSTVNAGVIDSN
jgi:hypothetical protein